MILRPATPNDAEAFFDHIARHFAESGKDGDVIFHPCPEFKEWKKEERVDSLRKAWAMDLSEPRWERAWVVVDESGAIRGHGTLRGAGLPAASHRCVAGLGLERPARGRGQGLALMETAITWAKAQDHLFWVDLNVFANNTPARKLYEQLGFQAFGMTMDLFRVEGESIDDIHMSLQIREE